MKSKFFKIALIFTVLFTGMISPNMPYLEYYGVEASGTKLPTSSTTPSSTVTSDLNIPQSMEEVPGTNHSFKNNIKKVFPKLTDKKRKELYYGGGLPFKLKDKRTGDVYSGYCAQSNIYASKNMTAKGVTSDPKMMALINTVTPNDPMNPTNAEAIAIQIVMWAGLNTGWAADMFSSGYMSTSTSAYTGMPGVLDNVKKIEANWANIINPPNVKQVPLQAPRGEVQVMCHPEGGEMGGVAEINWGFIGGGNLGDLDKVADITYGNLSGATVVKGSSAGAADALSDFGITPKKNSDYIIITNGLTTPGRHKITADITYKGEYANLNKMTLVTYDGGSANQPFIMPVKTQNTVSITLKYGCRPKPVAADPETSSTDIRWYNMPSAFGEMKNGVGFNNNSATTSGTYAHTRSGEYFEAMNGVPSTERFYANLGGTEGFLDVTYSLEEVKQPFRVDWETPWVIPGNPGSSGTEYFTKNIDWDFTTLHMSEATFRVFGDGEIRQGDLEVDLKIINKDKEVGSYNVAPNQRGLEVGPGTGDTEFNIGATKKWAPAQGVFTTETVNGSVAVEEDGKQEAYDKANERVGEIFAQNDELEITIRGTTYKFIPSVNKKTSVAYTDEGTFELDSTDGERENYFTPVKEQWDVWSHIPIAGYNGNPEDDGNRSLKGTPILLENIPLNMHRGNGIYEFETDEQGSNLDYDALVTTIKGGTKDLNETVDQLADGKSSGKGTVYGSPLDPINIEHYKDNNKLRLQYTNWQVPIKTGKNGLEFKHSGNEPDMNKDSSLGDNPTYRSINPILIHNPTTALYSWISDIPDSQLQDQRIDADNERISKHSRSQDGVSRQYINYDFQLTMPNVAAYEKYWGQVAGNSGAAGFEDNDFTYPGTLGKGYAGSAMSQVSQRSYENPYLGAGGWDVSKWITAKYVKFPYEVYYYKNSGEQGGDNAGFYAAGQWIQLYDNSKMVNFNDPTVFNFHVASEQKDVKDGIIYTVAETLNSPSEIGGEAEALYSSGEQYINGTRSTEGTNIGNYNAERDGEATYSAVNQINVDGIGRIGNTLISDTSDPAWASVFWDVKNGRMNTATPVQKDYGTTFNKYDSTVLSNLTGFTAYDRYGSLTSWHGESEPVNSLPLTTNVLAKGKTEQTVKMGYNVGGSLQTIGDYDYSMWIYPRNKLAGKFNTGNASQPFKLISSDPFLPGAKYQEYYDSSVNNTTHGSQGVFGKEYVPRYKHVLAHSLADPRAKMSDWEKKSASYQKAVQLGTNKKILLGNPAWMEVPRSLRTLIGSDEANGRWGPVFLNGNNDYGSKKSASSADCPCSYENAQKWNWNYSLPQNTKIWFNQNPENTSKTGIPKFESPSKDQYIVTSMTFRTKTARQEYPGQGDFWQEDLQLPAINFGDNYLASIGQSIPDWDLTMYTNTGTNTLPNTQEDTKNVPKGITPSLDPSKPMTWDPTQDGNISAPAIDMVWWNYSKDSTTDRDNVGSH